MTDRAYAPRIWLESLSGLLIWLVHFVVAYGAASLSLQIFGDMPVSVRIAVGILSLLLVSVSLWLATRRIRTPGDLAGRLRIATNLLALPAIVFQTLPILLTP